MMNMFIEMTDTDILDVNAEICALECENLVLTDSVSVGMMMESESSNIFTTIIEKIKKMVDRIKDAISNFFTKSNASKMSDRADKAFKNNPALKGKKVSIVDYAKLHKLNQDTAKSLVTTDDPEAVMEKYKKQRNIILGASAAVTLTLGALVALGVKKNKQAASDMEDVKAQASKNINDLKSELEKEIEKHAKASKTIAGLAASKAAFVDQLADEKLANAALREKMTLKNSALNNTIKNMGKTMGVLATQKNNQHERMKAAEDRLGVQKDITQLAIKDVVRLKYGKNPKNVSGLWKALTAIYNNMAKDIMAEVKDTTTTVIRNIAPDEGPSAA